MKRIELEQISVKLGSQRVYRVVKLTNCLEPAIGSEIPANEVQDYLSLATYQIVIREPKGRQ